MTLSNPIEVPMRIAVIGAGVAGVVASWILQRKHQVTLFEKAPAIGGHTATVVIDQGPDAGTAVDTGFIVLNDRTYPNFHRFLEQVGVRVRYADMSFGHWDMRNGFQYSGRGIKGLLADPANLFKPRMWSLMIDFMRFNRIGLNALQTNSADMRLPLGDFLAKHSFGNTFRDDYLVPMGASIWSTSNEEMLEFPTGAFLEFFRNHGLLQMKDRPRWQTVVGGSHSYLKAFQKLFTGKTVTDANIRNVERQADGVILHFVNGTSERFDKVVFAVHADQVLDLLADASAKEQELFAPWHYQENHTILHTDASVLPPQPMAQASWNFTREVGADASRHPVSITYDMKRLQGLQTNKHWLVSLNRVNSPKEIVQQFIYHHPTYTLATIATRPGILELNGTRNTYFTGSYFGFGFHEDAVRASVELMRNHFGLDL